MLLNSLLTKFVEKMPFTVMARAMLERMLSASRLDELFRTHASAQYERDLLFSQLVEVIARVVTRVDRMILKTIEALREVFKNLTQREASAVKVAELYQGRWTIEVVFHKLTMTLRCEVNTLGYPKAALFVFCVALMLENTLAMLMGSLRSVHRDEAVEEPSTDALSCELQGTDEGLMVAIPPEEWVPLGSRRCPSTSR
jgi:Transposase DDE domain